MCDADPLEGDRVSEGVQGGFEKVFGNKLNGICDDLGRDAIRSGRQAPLPTGHSAHGRYMVSQRKKPLDLAIAHTPQNSEPAVVNLAPNTTEHTLTLAEYLHQNIMPKGTPAGKACKNDILQGHAEKSAVTEIQALLDIEKVTISQVMMNKSFVGVRHTVIADLQRQLHLDAPTLGGSVESIKKSMASKGITWEPPGHAAQEHAKATWKKIKYAHRAKVSVFSYCL